MTGEPEMPPEAELASLMASGPPNNREAIERRRRMAFFLAECDRELGFPPGDRLEVHLHDGSFVDWLDKVLRAALASGGKLDPRRYRAVWTIKNAMEKT